MSKFLLLLSKRSKNVWGYVVVVLLVLIHSLTLLSFPIASNNDADTGARIKALVTNVPVQVTELSYIELVPGGEHLFSSFNNWFYSIPYFFTKKIDLFTVRFSNLIFLTICLALVYLVSKELRDRWLGIFSVILLGSSLSFFSVSHLGRPDFLAAIIGLFLVYLFLINKKNQTYVDFIIGAIFILGFDIHPRIILYFPLLVILYIYKYKSSLFRDYNFIFFILGLGAVGVSYLFLKIIPNYQGILTLKDATILDSRTPPILTLNFYQGGIALKELFYNLNLSVSIYYLIFIGLAMLITHRHPSDSIISLIYLTCLVFAPAMIPSFHFLNVAIVLPLTSILLGHFFCKIFFDFRGSSIASSFFKWIGCGLFLYFLVYNYYFVFSYLDVYGSKCQKERVAFLDSANKLIQKKDILYGDIIYWLYFSDNKFISNPTIKYLKNLKKYNISESFDYLKVDYLFYSRALDGIIKLRAGEDEEDNRSFVDKVEFERFLTERATLLIPANEGACDSNLSLYRINR